MLPGGVGIAGVSRPNVVPGATIDGAVSAALHTFDLTNTEGAATSTGFFRLGLAFEVGDVPSGQILEAEIDGGSAITVSQMQINTWSDGSLRSCILVGNAGSFTAGQTKTINVTAATGTLGTSSISGGAVSYLTGLSDDSTVEIRNHTGSTNSTNVGDIDFSLQTALGTSSRLEVQENTDVCVRVFAWQIVGSDIHLACLHYVDIWLDTDGATPIAYEWTPVMSQHWWVDDPFGVAMTKQERNYDATIKNGATTLETHTGLNHAYYCQWAGLRTTDDDQHAKRFWIEDPINGEAMPTLNVAYSTASRVKMMKAGYIPPLDLTATYASLTNETTFDPLGLTSWPNPHGHRHGINATGGYQGRGVVTNMDGAAIVEQTAARWRAARVGAQGSVSVFHHIKDHRNASGGAFDGDASMGLFPQQISRLGAQSYTGLAAETIAVTGLNALINDDPPNNATNSPEPTGSFDSWDDAHHTVYGYMMAFVEGERYLADAVLDQLSYLNMQNAFDGFVSNPTTIWGIDEPRATALSVPTTTYGFTYLRHRQERSFGWSQLSCDHVYALLADNDRHRPFIDNMLQTTSDLLEDSVDFFPASQLDTGTFWIRNPPSASHLMTGLSQIMFTRSRILHEEAYPGLVEFERLLARYNRDTLVHNPYASRFLSHMVTFDEDAVSDYVPRDERYVEIKGVVDNSGASTVFVGTNAFAESVYAQAGDVCRVSDPTGADPLPPELSVETEYYIINPTVTGVDDMTFQISATPGGSAITVTTPANPTADPVRFYVSMANLQKTFLGEDGTGLPDDDDFMTINNACCEYHYGIGGTEVSSADIAQIRTFFAPKTYSNFVSWNMDGDNIR